MRLILLLLVCFSALAADHDPPAGSGEAGAETENLGLATPQEHSEMYAAVGWCEISTKENGKEVSRVKKPFRQSYMYSYTYNGTGWTDKWGIPPEVYRDLYPLPTEEEMTFLLDGHKQKFDPNFTAGEGGGVTFHLDIGVPYGGYDPAVDYVFLSQDFSVPNGVKTNFKLTIPLSKNHTMDCRGGIRDLKTPAALLVWGAIKKQMELKKTYLVTLTPETLQKVTGLKPIEVEAALEQLKKDKLLTTHPDWPPYTWITH